MAPSAALATRRAALAGIGAVAIAGAAPVRADIVASFSVLADMARAVAPERLAVAALAGAGIDPHGFEPRPGDARALAGARLAIVNGLGFDDWAVRFARAAGFSGEVLVATRDVRPLVGPGRASRPDPHAWLDVANARLYARAIATAIQRAWPAAAPETTARALSYDAALAALDGEIRALLASVPRARRTIVTAHESFAYFGRAYGLNVLALNSASGEAAAARTASVIRAVRASGAAAAFPEQALDARGLATLQAETGVRLGGRLYADTLSGATGAATTYIALMRTNARTIAAALT
ncbi:MAG: metal ABC transporter substrate-binding protein [Alphaproteobacteria bacterium]|nr:metal ABC transporter substrate-binding protein [Alphaproteobacteria bacterium]